MSFSQYLLTILFRLLVVVCFIPVCYIFFTIILPFICIYYIFVHPLVKVDEIQEDNTNDLSETEN